MLVTVKNGRVYSSPDFGEPEQLLYTKGDEIWASGSLGIRPYARFVGDHVETAALLSTSTENEGPGEISFYGSRYTYYEGCDQRAAHLGVIGLVLWESSTH